MIIDKIKSNKGNTTLILPLKDSPDALLNLIKDVSLATQLKDQWDKDSKQSFTPIYVEGKWIIPINCSTLKNYQSLRKQTQRLSHQWKDHYGQEAKIELSGFDQIESDALINGLITGAYKIGKYKTSSTPLSKLDTLHVSSNSLSESDIDDIQALAAAQCEIMDLVNGPANKSNIASIIEWAKSSSLKYGYNIKVIDAIELESLGLHALLAVGRASPTPSRLLLLEYHGGDAGNKKIALVGKGITFDTGGVSIKGSTNMHYMKSDMGGAAAVLGAVQSAAALKIKQTVIGVVPLAENVIAGNALLPGDIINSYSGKTIEVIDTDAEGRLILADGLFYAQKHYAPDILIDLATLTGSAVRTFGYHCGALFSNNDDLSKNIQSVGELYGERLWPLPLWAEYAEDLYSDVADLRNLGALPLAGAIFAAKFLENFINEHPAWIHLDIAGVAFGSQEMSKQKSATGYGVKLLLEFIRNL